MNFNLRMPDVGRRKASDPMARIGWKGITQC